MSAVLEAREPSARYLAADQPPLVRQFESLATAPDGIARLRELILMLAVQGKLVSQNPSDEAAHESLKRIRDERQRLIGTGKVKTPKPTKEASGEELPFDVPSTWAWAPLADFVRVLNGRAYSKQELLDAGPTPVLRVGNLFTSDHWYYSNLKLEPEKLCNPGDLLFAWSASFGPFIWDGPKAIYHYHIWKLDPVAPKLFDTRYFHLFLKEKTAELKAAGHGVSMIHLTKEKMEKIPVPWPPLAEQARIVARVDELMRLCDALEAKGRLEAEQHASLLGTLLGTLTDSSTPEELAANWQRVADHFDLLLDRPEAVDALEQTILQLAVQGLLVPQYEKDEPANLLLEAVEADTRRLLANTAGKMGKPSAPISEAEVRFALPKGWSWARLSDISSVIVDCPHSTAKFVDAGILCLDTNSFKDGKLLPHKLRFVSQQTYEERIARLRPEPGDLVFAREGSVGESIIIPPGTVCCLGQRVMLFRLSNRVSNEFVRMAITTRDFLDALLSLHKGIGAKHVNVGDMRDAVVPVPPLREQLRIVTSVTELRRLCADLRQRLTASQTTQAHLAEALVDSAIA